VAGGERSHLPVQIHTYQLGQLGREGFFTPLTLNLLAGADDFTRSI